jgi:hypothetical protein
VGPLAIARIGGRGHQPRQHLQHVAVDFGSRAGQVAPARFYRRLLHYTSRHFTHAIEPRRAAEQFGDREQAVLGVLGGAE